MKTNPIMIRVNEMLLTIAKVGINSGKYKDKIEALRQKESVKSSTSSITNIMMKNLTRKMKVLILQITAI